ncbi:MAG: hypothetical protein IJB70_06860 [Clostridia bacterium]|nr:hypothetical protein [Clostridia bacterium]
MLYLAIFLLLHIICCVITLLGIYTRFLNIHKYMFFVTLFLPVWGFVIVLILHFQVFLKKDNKKVVPVEKMKLESELYKGVTVDTRNNADSIIPLEEALVINSAGQRRELIMDVLNDNPADYIEFLQKAGDNDDTEVVHYAVTAMVEISKENDYMLQKYERLHLADPDNYEVLCEYCEFLSNCLNQNLMQGQVEVMNRNTLNELLEKKLKFDSNIEDYICLIKNNLKLKNFTRVDELLTTADSLWEKSEDLILLKIEYYSTVGRGDELKKLINRIEDDNTYFSAEAKEAIAFWKT